MNKILILIIVLSVMQACSKPPKEAIGYTSNFFTLFKIGMTDEQINQVWTKNYPGECENVGVGDGSIRSCTFKSTGIQDIEHVIVNIQNGKMLSALISFNNVNKKYIKQFYVALPYDKSELIDFTSNSSRSKFSGGKYAFLYSDDSLSTIEMSAD